MRRVSRIAPRYWSDKLEPYDCSHLLYAACHRPLRNMRPGAVSGFCGREVVYVATLKVADEQTTVDVRWRWDAMQCNEIPASLRPAFATTDECKVARHGQLLLITSSSGGCAAIEYPSGKAVWFARVPNAHSIEWLPGDHLVVASSTHADGNKLVLFRLDRNRLEHQERPIAEVPLESAHGVVWDASRQRLWALGYQALQSYTFTAASDSQSARLDLDERFLLPSKGGHDLIAPSSTDELLLSTEGGVYFFDRDRKRFRHHPVIGDLEHIKSLTVNLQSQRLAYVQASEEQWWSNQFVLLDPKTTVATPKYDLYKLRWLPDLAPAP